MKIAITGHTRGIGKSIANALSSHEIIGLSRSNGFDISNTAKIIDCADECDMFINNAYKGFCQTQLLETFYDKWRYTDKTIINISSVVTDYPRTEKHLDNQPWDYRDHKRSLRDTFRKLIKQEHDCNMVLISPGATDTDMVKHLAVPKLPPEEIAKAIMYVLQNKYIRELVLYA